MRRYKVPDGYGQWLRFFRERAGLTQTELAAAAGIERQTLCHLENDRRLPSRRVANALARTLGVTAAELFPELDAPTPTEVLTRHVKARNRRKVAA